MINHAMTLINIRTDSTHFVKTGLLSTRLMYDEAHADTTYVRRGSCQHDSCTTGLLPTRLVYDGAPADTTRVRRGSCRHDSCTTGFMPTRLVYDGAHADTTRVRRGSCRHDSCTTGPLRHDSCTTGLLSTRLVCDKDQKCSEAPKSRRIKPVIKHRTHRFPAKYLRSNSE